MTTDPPIPQSPERSARRVTELCKKYGDRTILRNLSFSVEAGDRVALMGPSGSGKSTLLNCLGGIDRPDSGSVRIGDDDLTAMDGKALAEVRRRRVAHIFQFFHLLPTLTAAENIEFPLHLIGLGREEREERVAELIRNSGLEHRRHALPSELSGGEMQRVAIARALAPRPRIIFADEPTGNLDRKTGDAILELIESLCAAGGTTLFLVTHSEHATRICRRILHLLDGELTHAIAEL